MFTLFGNDILLCLHYLVWCVTLFTHWEYFSSGCARGVYLRNTIGYIGIEIYFIKFCTTNEIWAPLLRGEYGCYGHIFMDFFILSKYVTIYTHCLKPHSHRCLKIDNFLGTGLFRISPPIQTISVERISTLLIELAVDSREDKKQQATWVRWNLISTIQSWITTVWLCNVLKVCTQGLLIWFSVFCYIFVMLLCICSVYLYIFSILVLFAVR